MTDADPWVMTLPERQIAAGFQQAVDDLVRTVMVLEDTTDRFDLARLQDALQRRANATALLIWTFVQKEPRSLAFQREMGELAEMVHDVVPDVPAEIEWDTEFFWLLQGGAK